VKAFSFTSSCWRAASHSCADTIGGVFLGRLLFSFTISFSFVVAILFLLLCLKSVLKQSETTQVEKLSELADADRQNSSGRDRSSGHYGCTFDACWAHMCLL
jgi:hypothetical protein